MSNSMDYAVHGILQARILEWVTFPFSRVTSQHKDGTQVFQPRSALWEDSLPPESQGSPRILEWVSYPFYRASSRPRNPACRRVFYQLSYQVSSILPLCARGQDCGENTPLPSPFQNILFDVLEID